MTDESTALENLKQTLEALATVDAKELAERPSLGSLNFGDIKHEIQRSLEYVKELCALPLQVLPESSIELLESVTKPLLQQYKQLFLFRIEKVQSGLNPQDARDNLATAAWNASNSFLSILIPILPFLRMSKPDFLAVLERSDEIQEELKEKVATTTLELKTEIEGKLSAVDSQLEEIKTVLTVARETSAKSGVSRHADVFRKAAESHKVEGRRWLIASATIVIITVTLAFVSLYEFPTFGELREASVIQKIIFRIVILSLLYYSAIWSAKNYRSHRHLRVINSHRQNALETFESFVEGAAGDEQTKSAVLLEATHCIFSPSNTGYLHGEEENPTSRIIEILKTVGTSGK